MFCLQVLTKEQIELKDQLYEEKVLINESIAIKSQNLEHEMDYPFEILHTEA